jgi:hypothetical protein
LIKLTKGVHRDVDTFLGIAKLERWDEGTTLTQPEQAEVCGISYPRLKAVIQAIKENPEWGLSVHVTTRGDMVAQYDGNGSLTIVTFDGSKLGERETGVVREVGNDTLAVSVLRLVRGASMMGAVWKSADKRYQPVKDMKPYVSRTRSFLMSMREAAVADGDALGIQEQVERVLALYGVHYDAEDEGEKQAA